MPTPDRMPLLVGPKAMDILLVTEGTYPFQMGGVSVWCDQLVRGLPEIKFTVQAITASPDERLRWALPQNVALLEPCQVWGRAKPVKAIREGRFQVAFDRFCRSLVQTHGAVTDFLDALSELFHYAQDHDLEAAMTSNASVQHLLELWLEQRRIKRRALLRSRDEDIKPSLADALEVLGVLAHLMRPLSLHPARVDLVHCVSNGLSALVAFGQKWAHGTPFVLTEHGVYLRERYLAYTAAPSNYAVRALTLRFHRLLCVAAYQMADLVAPGNEYNHRWELRGGASSAKIRTVYNGIDLAQFPPPALEPARPSLTWLGRIDPLKDVHTLLHAFALVLLEVPDASLKIFGPTPEGNQDYEKSCRVLAQGLGLERSVDFVGRVASPLEAYHAGQVFLLTSISEGFPYTLIEAMATGRAVVATDVGGVAEAVGEAGVLVSPRDPEAMARACVRLLRSELGRRNLGAAARARVLARFSLERFLETQRSIYQGFARGMPVRRDPQLEAFIRYGRDATGPASAGTEAKPGWSKLGGS